MKVNHSLALIVAYYLSKYDKDAYFQPGYATRTETHNRIGNTLGVNSNSVKNMLDEFDPLRENKRAGWYQRSLRPSRKKVVEAFQDLTQEEFADVVQDILLNKALELSEDFEAIVKSISSKDITRNRNSVFIVRCLTGRKAEELFLEYHSKTNLPREGSIKDMRDYGSGYDFEIINSKKIYLLKIKD